MRYLWIVLLLSLTLTSTAQDVDILFDIFIEDDYPIGWMLAWSNDGQNLIYIDGDVGYCEYECEGNLYRDEPVWHIYDSVSGAITDASTWPLQPQLNPELEQKLATYGFRYLSPDGEWLLYLRYPDPPATTTDFFLYHYATDEIIPLDVPYCYGLCPSNLSNAIFWTTHNELIISFIYGTPFVAEPRIIRVELQNPNNVQIIDRSNGIQIGEHLFAPFDIAYNGVFDVVDDDVLMFANHIVTMDSPAYEYPNQLHLIVWSPHSGKHEVIAHEPVTSEIYAASFVPDDASKIVIVSRPSLLLFNRSTQEIIEIGDTSAINGQPVFSPDGEWLAIPTGLNGGGIGLINIPRLLGAD